MVDEIRNKIIAELSDDFNVSQLKMIDNAIAKALQGYVVRKEETLPAVETDNRPLVVKEFIARKRVKGCSEGTIEQYVIALDMFSKWAKKDLQEMTDLDILVYLDYIKTTRHLSNHSLENTRLILSTFYSSLLNSGKIDHNPISDVDPIKFTTKVREPLSDIEMESIRGACDSLLEKALVEVFYSTGARVAELVNMNVTDIDFKERRATITGKGDKQRIVFFNGKSLYALQKYIESRRDNSVALFVRERLPYSRLSISGVEYIIKRIGERAKLGHPLFPHLFRHTMATDMLNNGASINEVAKILGHEKIETTMIYAKMSTDDLATSHKKHIA